MIGLLFPISAQPRTGRIGGWGTLPTRSCDGGNVAVTLGVRSGSVSIGHRRGSSVRTAAHGGRGTTSVRRDVVQVRSRLRTGPALHGGRVLDHRCPRGCHWIDGLRLHLDDPALAHVVQRSSSARLPAFVSRSDRDSRPAPFGLLAVRNDGRVDKGPPSKSVARGVSHPLCGRHEGTHFFNRSRRRQRRSRLPKCRRNSLSSSLRW